MRLSQKLMTTLLVMFSLFVLSACGKESTGSTTCATDTDCVLGQVCGQVDKVCITADCIHCTVDQICYKPTPDSPGSCSAPQCTTNADCPDGSCANGVCSTSAGCVSNNDCPSGEVCNILGVCEASDGSCEGNDDCPSNQVCKNDQCVAGCSNHGECADDEYCSAESTCATGCRDSMGCPSGQLCTDGACACDATSCPADKVCLPTGNCGDATDCSQIDCGDQFCDPTTLSCFDGCTADSCAAHEICNPNSGRCEVNNCPGEDPNQCAGEPRRTLWDPVRCFCAECTDDSQCDTGAGETCNAAGLCFACQTSCSSSTPGTCGGDTPYCIDDCCVECVGAADCPQGEICLDGFCGTPPNCQVDPSVCPAGYTCSATGQCEAPASGGSCDPTDPTSCTPPSFCDPTSGTCQSAGGGLGCGLCNPDCTCDAPFSCNGFYCTAPAANEFEAALLCANCPNVGICIGALLLLGEAVCFPAF